MADIGKAVEGLKMRLPKAGTIEVVPSILSADFARLALIIHLAALIESKGKEIGDFKNGFIYLFTWVIMVAVLIFIQPNLSNGILVLIISLTILFVGGAKLKHILGSMGVCTFLGGIGAMFFTHSRDRIMTFIQSL